ncbi:MAG: hypothetical protein Q6362_008940 [Candidatus Wukongarchaeota archaeon]|nr:hypothetical protein [Candidatus Wukongarchaeota archaeon]
MKPAKFRSAKFKIEITEKDIAELKELIDEFNRKYSSEQIKLIIKPEEETMWDYGWLDWILIGAGGMFDGSGMYIQMKGLVYHTPQKIWDAIAGFIDDDIYDGAGDIFLMLFAEILDSMLEGLLGGGTGGAAIAIIQAIVVMLTNIFWSLIYEGVVTGIAMTLVN